MELQDMRRTDGVGSARLQAADSGAGGAFATGATERDALLSEQNNGGNGEMLPSVHAAEVRGTVGNVNTSIETSFSGRVKKEMNAVVFSRVRLWMVILLLIILIIAVITVSVFVVCSAMNVDEDETFDPLLFTASQSFNGSFELPNLVFTEELSDLLSETSQLLIEPLEGMLHNLFGSSPALGRYFYKAQINSFRNGSVIADYRLDFVMPEEDRDQLTKFTLSRETVYNVFRQFLYDQDANETERLYIAPASLSML